MATKILKLVSNQSGPFTVSNNKVDLTLPSYLSYIDATKTCIVLDLKLTSAGADLGLYDAGFNDGLDARCLLKNITISSSKNGVIEQIPACNVLYANIDQTQYDFEDLNAKTTFGYATATDFQGAATNRLGSFIRKVQNGTRLSTTNTTLKIPLSSIFGVCKMKQFPVNLFGDSIKISLEFEDDTKNIVPYLFNKTLCKPLVVPDVPAANVGSAVNTISIPASTNNPLYVGMPINCHNNADDTDTTRTITGISTDGSNTTITFSGAGVTFTATQDNSIKALASATNNKDLVYSIQDVELEVYQYNLGPEQQRKLNANMKRGLNVGFTTFSLERVNMPDVAINHQYTRQFDLEPNTINVFGMMPKQFDGDRASGSVEAQPLFSKNDGFSDYRWRLNTVDTTSRDVVPYQSLYNDRLMATLSNGYMKIKNLRLSNGKAPSSAIDSTKADASVQTFLIPSPIPKSDASNVIQLRMLKKNATDAANAGTTILHLWKQVQKQLKLQSGGIQVM